jgi:hypothetical protein
MLFPWYLASFIPASARNNRFAFRRPGFGEVINIDNVTGDGFFLQILPKPVIVFDNESILAA